MTESLSPQVRALVDAAANVVTFSEEITPDELADHMDYIVVLRKALEPFLGAYVEIKKT